MTGSRAPATLCGALHATENHGAQRVELVALVIIRILGRS